MSVQGSLTCSVGQFRTFGGEVDHLGVNDSHSIVISHSFGIQIKDGHEWWDLVLVSLTSCGGGHGRLTGCVGAQRF